MPRLLTVAAAQVGAVDLTADRAHTLSRLTTLLRSAASQGAKVVVFPEIAFTTFFPRHLIEAGADLERFFEHEHDLTNAKDTAEFFDEVKRLGVDVYVGYAERADGGEGYNACVYYSGRLGRVVGKYRKTHLPGTKEPYEDPEAVNQLEKRYFTPGDLGFKAFRVPDLVEGAVKKGAASASGEDATGKGDPILGMIICNDRRWPEAWRVLGLQGVELVMCGYNTAGYAPHLWGADPSMTPEVAGAQALFHHRLTMQANSYMNACYSISAARCGKDDGKYDLIGGSAIVDPEGYIVAEAKTVGDEVVVAEVDLEKCWEGKEKTFNFAKHRRLEAYGLITSQVGVVEPELLD